MRRLPADLLERSPEESARLLALAFLKEASDARTRLGDPRDTEALHDFRVAVRRLRSWCRAFQPYLKSSLSKKLRNRLRELTVATNAARDAEVLMSLVLSELPPGPGGSRNGTEWLVQRLENRRVEAQEKIATDAIAPFDELEPKLRRRLGRFETTVHLDRRAPRSGFGRVAGKLVRQHVAELREQLALVAGLDQVDAAHRARILAKRLRYLLEPLSRRSKRAKSLVSALRDLQDLLGEVHDTQVLEAEIGAAVEQSAAEEARRQHQAARQSPSPDAGGEPAAAADSAAAPPGAPAKPSSPAPDLSDMTKATSARLARLFERLRREWLEGRAEPLLSRIEVFGTGLEARRTKNVEVERKFLLTGVPELAREVEPLEIDQGWIAGELVNERVRRTRTPESDSYSRTIKLGSGVTRSEFEEAMTPDVFETIWPATTNRRISKRRYQVPDGERTWEIDEFTDRELVLAEVELAGEEEALAIPGWLQPYIVREVTGEPEYVNVNLAK